MFTIDECERCLGLVACRSQIVNGHGRENPLICFVGQNPGQNEDKAGRPFVGKSGLLLKTLCDAAGISSSMIYRTNAVRCLSPGNRKPKRDEIDNCRPHLIAELYEIKPRVIVTLGEVPLTALWGLSNMESFQTDLMYWEDECHELLNEWTNAVNAWQNTDKKERGRKPLKPKLPPKPKPPKARHLPLKDVAGQTLEQGDTGLPIIPSYHPAFLMRGKWNYAELVIAHLEKAKRLALGEL